MVARNPARVIGFSERFSASTTSRPATYPSGDKRNVRVVRKRNDLRYHHTLAVLTEFFGQRLATYERDVHEHRIQLDHVREFDEFGAGLIGAHHNYRLRMTPSNGQQGSLDGGRTTHVRAFRYQRQASFFKSPFHPVEAGAAE